MMWRKANYPPKDGRVGAVSDGGLANTVHVLLGLVVVPVPVVLEHQLAVVHHNVGKCGVVQSPVHEVLMA